MYENRGASRGGLAGWDTSCKVQWVASLNHRTARQLGIPCYLCSPHGLKAMLMGQVPRDTGENFQHWRPFRATPSLLRTPLFHGGPGTMGTPTPALKRTARHLEKRPRPRPNRPPTRSHRAGLVWRLECTLFAEQSSTSFGNDPSAGSPTETLLRLLLPLNDQV